MASSRTRHTPDQPDRDWWRRLPSTILARILLVALVALAPLMLLAIGSTLLGVFTIGNTARRENQAAAHGVANAFAAYVQDIRHQEVTIGTAIGTRGQPNWGWTNRLLATGVTQNPSLRNMSWVSSQGRVLASSATPAIGANIAGNAPIRQVLAGQTAVISDVLPTGPISKTTSIVIAQAIRANTGELLGILVAEINPDSMRDVLLRYQRSTGSVYAIFDRQGNLVASNPPRQGTWDERAAWRTSDPLLRRTLGNRREASGVVKPATFDAPVYAVYTPMAETGYIVGALLPCVNASAPLWRSALVHLLLLLLAIVLVGLAAYRIGSTIVDPLHTLQADVERLERQKPVPPLTEIAPTEVRALHTSVTALAAMLLQRIDTSETARHRLHTIFAYLPVGVRYVNASGEVLLANAIARELLGEDAVGMASTPRGRYTLHRQDGSPLPLAEIPLVSALHEGRTSRNMELIIRYEDGEGILALFSATPVFDTPGTITGVVEVVVEVVSDVMALQDIIVSTNLEQQLENAQTQLQTLMEILPVGVFILDAQGQIISTNPESTRLWGGVIPTVNSASDFRFFHGWWTRTGEPLRPDEWPAVRALTRNETVINEAITLNRFDGLRGNVRMSAAPIHNAQGAISGAVWVIQDPILPK